MCLPPSSASSRLGQMPKDVEVTPAVVCMMTNLIEPEELEDQQEAQELIEDITTECEKFGHLADPIKIHKSPSTGKIIVFVRYKQHSDCGYAIQKMDGRWFAGRQISAKSFPLNRYDDQNFD